MTLRALGLLALALLLPLAHAAVPGDTQTEVDFLLGYLAVSGCEFNRNGSWYDAAAAQAHLREKYAYLAALHRIGSADDFIEKAASESSISGTPYQVRCQGSAPVASRKWLTDELVRYRSRRTR